MARTVAWIRPGSTLGDAAARGARARPGRPRGRARRAACRARDGRRPARRRRGRGRSARPAVEHDGGVRDLDGRRDAAEPIGRDEEQAVVRADVEASVRRRAEPAAGARRRRRDRRRPGGRRPACTAACRRATSAPCRTLLRRDPVGDVDHVGVGRDALDDPVADAREVVLEAEVGQERDDASRDAASVTAATSPSRSCVVASATTARPRRRPPPS